MPNNEQIRKAAERREARKLAQENAKVTADAQDQAMPAILKTPSAPKPPQPSRAAMKAAKRKQAEEQADKDVRVVAKPTDIEAALTAARQGGALSLHAMNQLAQQGDAELRDEARAIADAAGKAAFQVATGKIAERRHRGDRFSRMRDADALAAEAAAKKAAAT